MFGGGLMQLVAYGAQDVYLTGCYYSRHIQVDNLFKYKLDRKYENFKIICDNKFEEELNKESLYFLNKEIYHFQVNLNNINNNPLLTIKPVPKRNKLCNDKLSNNYVFSVNKIAKVKNNVNKEAQRYQKQMAKAQLKIFRR